MINIVTPVFGQAALMDIDPDEMRTPALPSRSLLSAFQVASTMPLKLENKIAIISHSRTCKRLRTRVCPLTLSRISCQAPEILLGVSDADSEEEVRVKELRDRIESGLGMQLQLQFRSRLHVGSRSGHTCS